MRRTPFVALLLLSAALSLPRPAAAAPVRKSPAVTKFTGRFVAPVMGVRAPDVEFLRAKLTFAVLMSPVVGVVSRIVAARVNDAVLLVAVGVHAYFWPV